MPVGEIIKLILENSGLLGLAIFAIWMLNKVWEARLKDSERYAQQIDQMRKETLEALQQNTRVLTQLCEQER